MEKEVMEKLAYEKVQTIENEMYLARERALSDAHFYKQQKLAEANELKLTSEFMQQEIFATLTPQSKSYFGDSLPDMFSSIGGHLLFPTTKK